jgi:hypothetical protein
VVVVLRAHQELIAQQRQQAQLHELQGAQLCSLLYNINRDQKKGKVTSHQDWLFFRDTETEAGDRLPAVVASICLALRHEQRLPPLLVAIWKDVLAAVQPNVSTPQLRCLISADQSVVILAPIWEGQHLRGFLASKGNPPDALVEVTDLDRPLLRYRVQLPARLQPVHFEAGVLLLQHPAARQLSAAGASSN